MSSYRRVKKIWKSRPTIEGAGVHLKRAFGNYQVPQLDPFLLLDDFRSDDPKHTSKAFHGIHIEASKRLPMSSAVRWNMETALGTGGSLIPGTCNG